MKESTSMRDFKANFAEVKEGLSRKEAVEEANRCLYCYDAPCIQACPTGIDIPSFIKKIPSGNLKGSAKTIMAANPMGASCARVCPTEELCEGACVLNHSTKPIMIGDLQRYATDWARHNDTQLFQPLQSNGKTVAIIGGGPAGLSAARELALFGYEVTIFEAEKEAGGLNSFGIVSFRLPQAISFWEVEQVRKLNVKIKTNTKIGKDISAKSIMNQFDAVIFAVGMANVRKLNIPGEELEGVFDAIQFIKSTKSMPLNETLSGKNVVVIGAGNTAIDGATCAVRLGAKDVKIVYRRTQEEMTAYDFEYHFAKQEGVEFRWLTAPKRFIGNEEGKVVAMECVKMQLSERVEGGRRLAVPIKNSEFIVEVDAVIMAIGQERHQSLIEEFELNHLDGVVQVDSTTFVTSNSRIFACGDVIFGNGKGEAMVVTAAQQGKKAAYSVHASLMSRASI
ncbi:NAD(P)-dependent oxidoreductase [Bacillus spongiae]|uniref:NAD(P)-dependent oxidoreductase n=1 Tax=Bacillus spongiae TaxID=2683610 RepID=A0ABU8HGG5_9BACI